MRLDLEADRHSPAWSTQRVSQLSILHPTTYHYYYYYYYCSSSSYYYYYIIKSQMMEDSEGL